MEPLKTASLAAKARGLGALKRPGFSTLVAQFSSEVKVQRLLFIHILL